MEHNRTEQDQIHRDNLAHAVKGSKKTSRKKSVIDACKQVIEEKQCTRFRGTLLDHFSASAVMNVYNALNEENKAKFAAFDDGKKTGLLKMVNVAFALHKKKR